jgi:hypothetical protein
MGQRGTKKSFLFPLSKRTTRRAFAAGLFRVFLAAWIAFVCTGVALPGGIVAFKASINRRRFAVCACSRLGHAVLLTGLALDALIGIRVAFVQLLTDMAIQGTVCH